MVNNKLVSLMVMLLGLVFASSTTTTLVHAGSNTNQCLQLLGALNTACPQSQLIPGLQCCLAVSNFNKAGCFCNPAIKSLAGADNINLIELVVKPACLVLSANPLWWLPIHTNKANWGIVLCNSFKKKTYNGGSCSLNDMELDNKRIQSSIGVSTVIQQYVAQTSCFNYQQFLNDLAVHLEPQPEVIVSLGIGSYNTLETAAEYLALVSAAVNKDYWWFRGADNPQTDPNAMLHVKDGGDMIVLGGTGGGIWWKGCYQSNPVYMEQNIFFQGCNTKIKTYYVPSTSTLTGAPTGLYDFVNRFYLAPHNTKTYGYENICQYHENYCTGPNKQFVNFAECMRFMEALPEVSPECGNGLIMSGNSSTCRFKHAFMIPLAPADHCFHIGYGHTPDSHGKFKCSDTVECVASNPALGNPQPLSLVASPGDAACMAQDVATYTTWQPPNKICPGSFSPDIGRRRVLRAEPNKPRDD